MIAKEYLKLVRSGALPKVAIQRLTAKYQVHRSTIYRNVRILITERIEASGNGYRI